MGQQAGGGAGRGLFAGLLVGRRAGLAMVGLAFAALALGGILYSALAEPFAPRAMEPVAVSARPIAHFKTGDDTRRFGPLEFRGGLVLSSPYKGFGGISGFMFDGPDGHFLAITDVGLFLTGRLETEGDRPVGLADVTAIAIGDGRGRPMVLGGRADAESLALAPDAAYVGFEGANEIRRYPRPPFGAPGRRVPASGLGVLKNNQGLETLFYVPSGPLKGALIGIGEEDPERADTLPGFIVGGPRPGAFTLSRKDAFAATDAAVTPDGDVILLERHFTRLTGVKMRLRRFPLAAIRPGAVIDPEVLGTFDMGYDIDNMEGLAISRNGAGETLLTLISDDNFNPFQRTVLLRFALASD